MGKIMADAAKSVEVVEEDFTEEETRQQIRENEGSLLEGLLAAADYAANEEMTFEIRRGGKFFFSFTVHPISEEEMYKIRKMYMKYAKNRRAGVKVAEELDVAKFRCSVIYNSTVDRDKAAIWDNRELWAGLEKQGHVIINALDVIEAVLLPGEKDKIMESIDRLGGYGDDDEDSSVSTEDKRIELAKN